MDEEMIRRWNEVVREQDKVYHLGDVVINMKFLNILERLNGTKRLIRGNHDIGKTKDYLKYFKEIHGVRVLEDIVLSHVPLHPGSVTERWNCNVHGHLHANIVERPSGNLIPVSRWIGGELIAEFEPDPLYVNVSVEQINYTPIEFSELRALIKDKREKYGQPDFGAYVHRKL